MIDMDFRSAQRGFFDRPEVIRRVGRAAARVLGEAGRLVRKAAQKSLAYGEGSSPPGRPPTAHKTGHVTRKSRSTGKTRVRRVSYLREFLFFAYDARSRSVVVGPVKLNAVSGSGVPHALEHGGTTTFVDRGRRKSARVAARPFMRPALQENRAAIGQLWRDSIR